MNLDEEKRRKVAEWIDQGLKISEVQGRLDKELGVSMTYMEVRFLMDDLKLRPKDPAPPVPAAVVPEAVVAPTTAPSAAVPAGAAKVSVAVDQLAKPGALVSGKVTFTDGQTAEWYLDQMGRLGLVGPQKGYRPPQEDVAIFQQQLQDELAKLGL